MTRDPVRPRPRPAIWHSMGHPTLRRSATMAGSSGTGSFPHSFHHGRGNGGGGGWKLQTASALRIRCSRN